MKNSQKHRDYSVTIFSRHKGKSRTFSLNRRFLYFPLVVVILLVVSCLFFGQAYFQERGERQRLEGRVVLLEQLMNKFEKRSEKQAKKQTQKQTKKQAKKQTQKQTKKQTKKQTAETLPQAKAVPAASPPVSVALRSQEKEASAETRVPEIQISGNTETDPQSVGAAVAMSKEPSAKIDDAKVSALEEDREGFRLDFKLVNLIGEPISGNVAIIASLRPPHQPRFVSFPSMNLVEGMPVRLRKSVGFNIRYFKYITGRFYFPFSYSESFRILIYDQDEQLILDSTFPAEQVAVHGLVSEEPAPPLTPYEPSLSSLPVVNPQVDLFNSN